MRNNPTTLRRWSTIPLRLIVGYGFIVHGYSKIVNGPEQFAAILQALGVPAPRVAAWTTIGIELVGGLAVLAGAWIPLVSVPLAAVLLVAVITVHLPYGFTSIKLRGVTATGPQFDPPGYETNVLYLAALVTLVLGGAGPLSIEQWLADKRDRDRRSGTNL